jgi:hypothetical protein
MAKGSHAQLVSASVVKPQKTLKHVQGDAFNGSLFSIFSVLVTGRYSPFTFSR